MKTRIYHNETGEYLGILIENYEYHLSESDKALYQPYIEKGFVLYIPKRSTKLAVIDRKNITVINKKLKRKSK